ncbi:TetR/AcrR family transcriptional regulator [Microbulbifer sp.]|uniref:TetR/AcrR family transcriptional regulator n=1 Tax=Microbulbifer sp. TaxID=1908541 RepID=UPI003F3DE05C
MTTRAIRKPLQERAEATREKILDVARQHFAENGFSGTSLRDIARDCGVSHAMIRYHFATKDNLWREAVRDMFARLRAELGVAEGELASLDTLEGLREFLRRYIHYCARHPEHARIMISESVHGGERLQWMAQEFIQPGHAIYAAPIRRHMEKGNLPQAWLPSLMFTVAAICQMPFVLAPEAKEVYGVDMLSEPAVEAHVDSVLSLLLRLEPAGHKRWPALPDWLKN